MFACRRRRVLNHISLFFVSQGRGKQQELMLVILILSLQQEHLQERILIISISSLSQERTPQRRDFDHFDLNGT